MLRVGPVHRGQAPPPPHAGLGRKGRASFGVALLALLALLPAAHAAQTTVPATADLQAAIAAAAPGDTLLLAPGTHRGPVQIDRPIVLNGEPGTVIDGQHTGSTVKVTAPDVVLRHLEIRNSGRSLEHMDAGVFLSQAATGAVVEDSTFTGNLVGVWVHGAARAIVQRNRIAGWNAPNRNDSGNGVYVWNAPGAQVLDNDIAGGRDGIFTNASRNNLFRGNRLHGVRFAVHYMYTNDSEVSDNVSTGNHAGYVLMFSNNLIVRGNVSKHDRDHGMLFNYANRSQVAGNVVRGGEKCVFIYNANMNRFTDNWFQGCDIGVHFTAGSERNTLSGNAFVGNRTQVKYVGTRNLDWSANGRGNYWSDNAAFDLDGDGIADEAYRPNDLMDQVVWRAPLAKLLMNSPAVQVVRWAQSQFPALHPGGVIDSAPLMHPPRPPALAQMEAAP
jgi:nitrous oxidase accessory protein